MNARLEMIIRASNLSTMAIILVLGWPRIVIARSLLSADLNVLKIFSFVNLDVLLLMLLLSLLTHLTQMSGPHPSPNLSLFKRNQQSPKSTPY